MKFHLDKEQIAKLEPWCEEQDRIVYERQLALEPGDPIGELAKELGGPYYGAIGGALTYCFSPTSLGTVVKVKHAGTGAILDLSDYDSW